MDLIRPLWQQLNEHHHATAFRFRSRYARMTFEDRKWYFQKIHETGQLRLDPTIDTITGMYAGYCVSSESAEHTGEVEFLFVKVAHRSQDVGTALVSRALAWMDSLGTVRKRVSVGQGNEAAWAFYQKFGFYLRMMVLEQKTDEDD